VDNPVPENNVIKMELTAPVAIKIAREVAQDSGKVFFKGHAERRMKQRKITRPQVITCLRSGRITEGPFRSIEGNWQFTINCLAAGDSVTVVAALDNDGEGNYVIVITVHD